MKTFKQFLAESRQDLYHGTSLSNFHDILKDGHIRASDNGRVSLSRNHRYASEWAGISDHHPVRLVIDANSLRHTNNVRPVDFDHNGGGVDQERYKSGWEPSSGRRAESEESVKGDISLKHVKEAHMKHSSYNELASKRKTKSERELHKEDPHRDNWLYGGMHHEDRMKQSAEFHANLKKHGIKLHLHD